MHRLFGPWIAVAAWCVATVAHALPETFQIDQAFSSADGSVQFVVIKDTGHVDCDSNENLWAGLKLSATGPAPTRTFVFPANLPNCRTSGRRMLVGTEAFAALGLVTPDFVMPNGFLQIPRGSLDFAGISALDYTALPDDGVHALSLDGTVIQNVATNYAGASGSVQPSMLPPPAQPNFEGLFYNAPAESEAGWGINFAHQGDIIFATWFTYDAGGRAWWLTMTADRTAANTYGGTLYETRGPAFNSVPFSPAAVSSVAVGTGTLTFADSDHATFQYRVNGVDQTKTLVRQVFGAVPTCTFPAPTDATLATNYQDLWWAAPEGSESGWGVNFTHQGDAIFATWFTYDVDGKPLWLSATARAGTPGHYAGTVYRTTGPAFNAVPWDKSKVALTPVGDLALDFRDGNHANFHYTLTLGTTPATVDQTKSIVRQVFRSPGTVCN